MNIPSITLKSTLLATFIFWSIIAADGVDFEIFPFILLSIIPIFIICLITNLLTVAPFFSLINVQKTNKKIFLSYFPYYSILCFAICVYFVIVSNMESLMVAFFSSAFFTSIKTWIWFALEKDGVTNKSINSLDDVSTK